MAQSTTAVKRVQAFLKGRKAHGKVWNDLYDLWIIGQVGIKYDEWGYRTQVDPSIWNMTGFAVRTLAKRYIPGYKRFESFTKAAKRKVDRWMWTFRESRLNQWLHTTGKRHAHTCFGLFRYVNVYQMDLCYGGPEEGGWYYDAYSLVASHRVLARKAQRTYEALCAEWEDPHEIATYTNVNGGRQNIVLVEDWKGQSETTSRPRYE